MEDACGRLELEPSRTGNGMTSSNVHVLTRRNFLRATGAGLAAMALPHVSAGGASFEPGALSVDRAGLVVLQEQPFNGEPPLSELTSTWLTPVEKLYVRNHAPTPRIDSAEHRLHVTGLVERELELSVRELQRRFSQVSVLATMQCAGNRRREHSATRLVDGVQWGPGAIGTAEWTGVSLAQVLQAAGLRDGAAHVHFTGLDEVERSDGTIPFGASIPMAKASEADTLLAYAMNGEPLTPDHGFPIRVVVPGFIGARSVKWVETITVSDRPSDNHYQASAYKIFPPDITADTVRWNQAPPLRELPVNSVISIPEPGQTLAPGVARVRGWVYPGGTKDAAVERVEISADAGATWRQGRIVSPRVPYCWRLWEADIELTAESDSLVVRAASNLGETQPEIAPWNFKGYFYNAWHRIPVKVG